MLRLTTAFALAMLPATLVAQTTPNDPESPAESFGTTVPAPTTYATEPDPTPVIDVDRLVVLGFPGYDSDGVGGLSIDEFGAWMTQLFANAGQPRPTGEYVTAAFAQTDTNKDGVVNTGELALFLKGG